MLGLTMTVESLTVYWKTNVKLMREVDLTKMSGSSLRVGLKLGDGSNWPAIQVMWNLELR